jgi:fructokinase
MRIVSIGEILWDVFDDAEHLGGAVFNFAAHAARLGHQIFFVSAVGDDERGRRALERTTALGLSTRYVSTTSEAPTGIVTVTVAADGQPSFVIHRPAAYDAAQLSDEELAELVAVRPDWVTFGTLQQTDPRARELVRRASEALPGARRFYDVNLRRDSYTPDLVDELLAAADVVKLNEDEARQLSPGLSIEQFCRQRARRHGWQAVCVTRGAAGCSVLIGGEFRSSPGYKVEVVDSVGAGDAFSAAFLHGLFLGWDPDRTADFANRVGALIASRPGGTPEWTVAEAEVLPPPATQ